MDNPLNEWWYAIKTYQAPSEEQLSAIAGEPLQLLDDSDNEWWYALSPRTELAGYIPALFIESTESRRARLNTAKNKQLTLTMKEDYERAAKHKAGKKKKISFDTIVYFDDGTQMAASQQRSSATFKRKSFSQLLASAKATLTTGALAAQAEPVRDLRAEMGVLRIHADIWNLEATYRAVKVTNETTAAEVLRSALERFNAVDDGKTEYGLYLVVDGVETRIPPHGFPFVQLNSVPEKAKANAKIQLKKLQPEKDAIPLRVYGEEDMYKTIMIDRQTTVGEAVSSVVKKFKLSSDDNMFRLREVKNGTESFCEPESLLYDKVIKANDGNSINQKFFLARKPRQADAGGPVAVRIYGHGMDLDVAYRSVLISAVMATPEVTRIVLERYNASDGPAAYNLVLVTTSQEEHIMAEKEFPLAMLQEREKKHPTAITKIHLRKRTDTTSLATPAVSASERIVMTKMPMRVYADYLTDGATDFKTILLSDTTRAGTALKQTMEKFKIAPTEPCYLAMSSDQQGLRTLDDEEIPLLVRNEMIQDNLSNIRCVIRKGTIDRSKAKFAVRVMGHRVWSKEGYKSIMVDVQATARELVAMAYAKFKLTSPPVDQLCLCLLTSNPDEDTAKDIRLPDDYVITHKVRMASYGLYTTKEAAGLPTVGADGTSEGRRVSLLMSEQSDAAAQASANAAANEEAGTKAAESAKGGRGVGPSPLAAVTSVDDLTEGGEDEEDYYVEESMLNPLMADQMDDVNDPLQQVHLSAMTITVAGTDVEGTISPSVIRERPHSVVDNQDMLHKLNEKLRLEEGSPEE